MQTDTAREHTGCWVASSTVSIAESPRERHELGRETSAIVLSTASLFPYVQPCSGRLQA